MLPIVAGAILFFTYLVLAIGKAPYLRVDRTGAAVVGATLMVATGVTRTVLRTPSTGAC